MKFTFHPSLAILFLALIFSGHISTYAMLFFSLLFHEFGHLLAAYSMKVKVKACVIMPYGGQLIVSPSIEKYPKKQFIVAIGGLLATSVLAGVSSFLSFPSQAEFLRIQMFIFLLNSLPFLPLDGGQVVKIIVKQFIYKVDVDAVLLFISMFFFLSISVLLLFFLPNSMPYVFLSLFLAFQNLQSWRYRKYAKVLRRYYLKELT